MFWQRQTWVLQGLLGANHEAYAFCLVGRIRRRPQVPEMNNRYLRVILLPDGETVLNAFFDRGFVP